MCRPRQRSAVGDEKISVSIPWHHEPVIVIAKADHNFGGGKVGLNLDPSWIWLLVAAPAIGSFLGVLAVRLPRGEGIAFSRSACRSCGHTLGIRDLIPIFSWVLQRGRCRYCKAAIGLFYPGIEMLAVAAVIWAALSLPPGLVWVGCLLGWWLIVLAVIDARDLILPDVLTLPLLATGLAVTWFIAPAALGHHIAGAVAGFAVIAIVGFVYRRIRGRDGIGLGDAKLMAAAGAWVSWTGLPGVLLIAALTGIAVTLVGALMGQRDLAAKLPFGPHIALGTWIIWVHGPLIIY
jgi:leader peptidase (prepilin peptidase)/N-methyltransferase